MHLAYQTCHAEVQLGLQEQHMLLLQLTELNLERNKMNTEKVNLENQLEAEQEYILNKLHKQVRSSCTSRYAQAASNYVATMQQKQDAVGP